MSLDVAVKARRHWSRKPRFSVSATSQNSPLKVGDAAGPNVHREVGSRAGLAVPCVPRAHGHGVRAVAGDDVAERVFLP